MSFTVPLYDNIIVAIATVVTSYFLGRLSWLCGPMCCGGVCVAMSCGGGGFTRDGAYDFVWDSVRLMTGKYTIYYFQYQGDVGCVCMLNDCGSAATTIFALTTILFRFKLKGKCRSEKWEVYLCGDMTIKVVRAQAQFLVQFLDSVTCPLLLRQGMASRRAENCGGLRSCSSWRDGMSF